MQQTANFDAIVVGSGITGGLAAKELTERGLSVLMLERGKQLTHGRDYIGEHMPPWKIPYRGKPLRDLYAEEYPIQNECYAFDETTRHFWNNDKQNPYIFDPDQPFKWLRSDVVGGRSLLWGRQSYRWSDIDFESNKADGNGVDWPIRYDDLAPWYSHVENFIGVSGQYEKLPQLPDSEFQPAMAMNGVEKAFRARLKKNYPDRTLTMGRTAVLTEPKPGRAPCHYCGPCHRGCSAGAYFSTQSSTLPAAMATGKLTLKANSLVHSVEYDAENQRVSGVNVIDTQSFEKTRYSARIVVMCASTVGTAQILLNSKSESFPNGLANSSGVLGHYLMDHVMGLSATGIMPGFTDIVEYGNRPTGTYLPRFVNIDKQSQSDELLRGFGYQVYAGRMGWNSMKASTSGIGADLKTSLTAPGPWSLTMIGYGECLPRFDNFMALDERKPDRFGVPQVKFNFSWSDNEDRLVNAMTTEAASMLSAIGAIDVTPHTNRGAPGDAIHEMGTARMGHDPATSVLNAHNQAHDVPNLFVTDGSCMTSSACVNPSLTYMAITARACDYAARQLSAGML